MIAVALIPPTPGSDAQAVATLGSRAAALAKDLGLDLGAFVTAEKLKGAAGQIASVPILHAVDGYDGLKTVLLVGIGAAGDGGSAASVRTRAAIKTGASLARAMSAVEHGATTIVADLPKVSVRPFVEGVILASYTHDPTKTSPDGRKSKERKKALASLTLVGVKSAGAKATAALEGVATAAAVCSARELVNQPSMTKTPDWLAKQARALVAGPSVKVSVLDEKQLAAQGFGGILGVGQGSPHAPRLVQISYTPQGPTQGATQGTAKAHVVLIGKGITFDSGGLSLKPNDGMVAMKTDMGGAGAVVGAMSALATLGVRVKVTALLACAENMPSGTAMRPGDVLKHYGGTTVEVLNTDAEGRLVLADALAYAAATLKPDAIVDLATLTGAMPVALGKKTAGLFATEDALAQRILVAGAACGERAWRMPLTEDYRDALESPVADLNNIGRAKSYQGGSITAALFLREFTAGTPWAHLDIAGTGRCDGDDEELTKGGTGYGVRTLLRLLESW